MFHKKVNVTGIPIFSKFIQLFYKSKFAFSFYYIKIAESIGPDGLHSIGET